MNILNGNTTRSLNSVEKALSKMTLKPPNPKLGADYLMCRYGEAPASTVRVPDGVGRNLATNDYLSVYDIDAKGPFSFSVTPTFPQQGIISCPTGSTVAVNGTNVVVNTVFTLISDQLAAFSKVNDTTITTDFGVAARVIAVRWKLTYTGAAATCQGLIQAHSAPIRMDSDPRPNDASVNLFARDGTARSIAAGRTNVAIVDIASPLVSFTPNRNTIITRPEHGLHGFLKRNVGAKAHAFRPMWQQQPVLCRDTSGAGNPLTAVFSDALVLPSPNCGTIVMDHDFDYERVDVVVGTGVASTFRLTVVTCMEVEHSNNFAYISLTSNAAPLDDKVLSLDDKLNTAMVHAAPLTMSVLPVTGMQAMIQGRRPRRRRQKGKGNGQPKGKNGSNNRPARRARRARNRRPISTQGTVVNNFK